MTKILLLSAALIIAVCLVYWLILTPKTNGLLPQLDDVKNVEYQTSLLTQVDSAMPESVLLRRVRDSEWQTSGEHTDFQLKEYKESSMSVANIKLDAYLKESLTGPTRILIGRFDDRGAGMHGWHVTMVRQGDNSTSFDRHQRYYVWIEKDFPTGFKNNGEPISADPKRWYFAGLADIVSQDSYQGYVEPAHGDK